MVRKLKIQLLLRIPKQKVKLLLQRRKNQRKEARKIRI